MCIHPVPPTHTTPTVGVGEWLELCAHVAAIYVCLQLICICRRHGHSERPALVFPRSICMMVVPSTGCEDQDGLS